MKNPVITNQHSVLVVDNSRAVTGALNAMRHTTNALRNEFSFVYVLPTGSAGRQLLVQDGYEVQELPFVEISRRKMDLFLYVPMLLVNGWRLYRLARRTKVTVVHLNDFYNLTGYVAQALSLGRLRVVTHVRFLPQSLLQPLARTWRWMAQRFSTRVICVSVAVRHYFGPLDSVQVIYDPLPGLERHPVPLHTPAADSTVSLLYLSNYIPGKGQDLALKAFAIAYARDANLRLRFVGGDMGLAKNREFRQQLQARVENTSLQDVVSFEGFATDVEDEIKRADILLNFSESESFSLTCLDALYYGTPLIASDCGGPAELFEQGKSGLLVPNRNIEAMAGSINKLASDRVLREQFAIAGRAFVRQKFASSNTYYALATLYREIGRMR